MIENLLILIVKFVGVGLIIDFIGELIIKIYKVINRSSSGNTSIDFHKVHKDPETGKTEMIFCVSYTGFPNKETALMFLDGNGLTEKYDYCIIKDSYDAGCD